MKEKYYSEQDGSTASPAALDTRSAPNTEQFPEPRGTNGIDLCNGKLLPGFCLGKL